MAPLQEAIFLQAKGLQAWDQTVRIIFQNYFLSKIPPFNYPGTLRVIQPGSGSGNGKFQKIGSGLGTPLLVMAGYPGNSLPGQVYL